MLETPEVSPGLAGEAIVRLRVRGRGNVWIQAVVPRLCIYSHSRYQDKGAPGWSLSSQGSIKVLQKERKGQLLVSRPWYIGRFKSPHQNSATLFLSPLRDQQGDWKGRAGSLVQCSINLWRVTGTQWPHSCGIRVAVSELFINWNVNGQMKDPFICCAGRCITAALSIDFLPSLILGWDIYAETAIRRGGLIRS